MAGRSCVPYAPGMHVIDRDNHGEALDAMRDILMLYVDLTDTRGFGHAADIHIRFDPLMFVDAQTDGSSAVYVDMDLLRAGSAIAILCTFYDLWCEEQHLKDNSRGERYQLALEQGRLAAFPDVEAVLREAIRRDHMPIDDPWMDEAVEPIYRKYVLGFFRRLAAEERADL